MRFTKQKSIFALSCVAAVLFGLSPSLGSAASLPVEVGVYYYPGWSPGASANSKIDSWLPILPFPEKLPADGTYFDDSPTTLRRQLNEMKSGGINFVVFDWYIQENHRPRNQQALKAYMQIATDKDPKMAIMWSSDPLELKTESDWQVMAQGWISNLIKDPRYLKFNGKPTIFIFAVDKFRDAARSFGSSPNALLSWAREQAISAGLPGISFIAESEPPTPEIAKTLRSDGYSGISAYNIGASSPALFRQTPGYLGYDQRYRKSWPSYIASGLPVILPLSTGWDRRPWGGSRQSIEDNSESNPEEFRKHLDAGLSLFSSNLRGDHYAVICCWNEYGEGSVLEPTVKYGNGHLKSLKAALDK